tara:strand:- start:140 stop:358 length:219 start_codon:yes stop_codon:yes gene_type:complete
MVEEDTEVLEAVVQMAMLRAAAAADTAAVMEEAMEIQGMAEVPRIQDRIRPIPQVHAVDMVRSSLRIYPVHP